MRNLPHSHEHPHTRAGRQTTARFMRRRGVAMLLVIISVMTATILTMSYLSSRDNSMAIGQNAIEASAARWSALSGIDLALATLQTASNWRVTASTGVLIDNFPFLDGHLTVHIADADTNAAPTADTVLVNLMATFNGGGIEQHARAFAALATPSEGVFQLDLADFALFADERIRLTNGGLLARWETAPRTKFGLPIPIGVRSTDSDSIEVSGASSIIDGVAHYFEGASPGVIDSSQTLQVHEMQDVIPLPEAPPHNVDQPASGQGHLNSTSNVIMVNQLIWDRITVQPNRWIQIPNDSTVVVGTNLDMQAGSSIRVESDTTMVVFGDVELKHGSYIQVAPDATLRLYVGGELTLDRGYIGRARADTSVRDRSGSATWMDPNRIQIFSFADSDVDWGIEDTSVIKGSIYAPKARIVVKDDSAVYGRIAARRIRIRDGSSVFYDHTLDRFAGYANPKSLVFDPDGYIYESLQDMPTIDPGQLLNVADTSGLRFRVFGLAIGTGDDLFDIDGVGSGDPTPRPIAVDYQLLSVGIEPRSWE